MWALILAGLVAKWPIKALPKHFSQATQDAGHTLIIASESSPGSLKIDMERGLRHPLDKNHEGFITISNDPWRYFISLKEENPHKELLSKIDRYDENDEFIGPKLLIIDPLIDFHDADENSAGQMIKILKPLRDWAIKHDSAVVVVHHTGKPLQENRKTHEYGSLDLRGTSAIFGKADCVLVLTTPGEGIVTPVKLKGIFKRAGSFKIELDLAVWDSALLEGKEKLGEIDNLIILNSHLSIALIAQKTGLTEKEVEIRLSLLRKRGLVK